MEPSNDLEAVRKFTEEAKFKRAVSIQHLNDKVVKILPKSNSGEFLTSLTYLNSKYEEYSSLFVFIIQTDNLKACEIPNLKDITNCLNNYTSRRSIILKIISKTEHTFYLKEINSSNFIKVDLDLNDLENQENLLKTILDPTEECINDQSVEKVFQLKDSSIFLKLLRNLIHSEIFIQKFILRCISKGKFNDFQTALIGNLKPLDEKAQNWISTTFSLKTNTKDLEDFKETSILNEAIIKNNEKIVNFLISKCTHLIQQLPFDHRVEIMTNLLNSQKYHTLCDLLKISDFPFPKDFEITSITDKLLKEIAEERRNFHDAITSNNSSEIEKFVDKYFSLKLSYNHQNETAISTALISKNYDVYSHLKSLGFTKDDEKDDPEDELEEAEKNKLSKILSSQTQINVRKALPDARKCVYFLMARSFIHNRMLEKPKESVYREKIRKWYEIIFKIPLCSKFLDVASQCKDLKIIFDFDSEHVGSVDLRHSGSLGTMHPKNKWIFIGAKENYTKKFKIEGVLIHEICHYVMNLLYENNENPYFKNDHEAYEHFNEICNNINELLHNNSSDDSFENDECDQIISSVFYEYDQNDYHPELIVRPLQILVQYNENKDKTSQLIKKYQTLFDYIENFVVPEIEKYNQRNRESAKKFNKSTKIIDQIIKQKFKFTSKITQAMLINKCSIICTNVPKLLLQDIYQLLCKTENLVNVRFLFTKVELKDNTAQFEHYKEILKNDSTSGVIIDCSEESKEDVKHMIQNSSKRHIIVVSNKDKSGKIFKNIKTKFNEEPVIQTVNYSIDDFLKESQEEFLRTKINFQNKTTILHDLLNNSTNTKEETELVFINIFNQVDSYYLKQLVDESHISIHSNYCDFDDKHLNTFQPRKFIKYKTYCNETPKEYLLHELISDIVEQFPILISDISGAGKSWVFQKITIYLRDKFSNRWINYIDLKNYTQILTHPIKKNPIENFVSKNFLKLESDFEKTIFKAMYKSGKVTLLFDGYSEIPKEQRENFKKLIMPFEYETGNQLWIATRKYDGKLLIDHFGLDEFYKLDLFTKQNGINLITKTWELNVNIHQELKIKIEDYQRQASDLCDMFFKSEIDQIGFPQMYTTIAEFYKLEENDDKRFTFNVFQAFLQKHCSKAQKGFILSPIEIHQYFATKDLCPEIENFCDFKYEKSVSTDQNIMAIGLVRRSDNGFIIKNEIFRNFFIADFIVKHPFRSRSIDKNDSFTKLVMQICTSDELKCIRMFLDGALSDDKARDKLESVLMKESKILIENTKLLLDVAFKEDLTNILKLELNLFNNDNSTAKEISISFLKDQIKTSKDTKRFCIYQRIIVDYLSNDDIKRLIEESEICHGIIRSNMDVVVFEELINLINKKIKKGDLIRQTLNPENRETILHSIFKFRQFDFEVFTRCLNIFYEYLARDQMIDLLNKFDTSNKSLLQICIDAKDSKKLKFICDKVKEKLFMHKKDKNEYKSFITLNNNKIQSNILHSVARCDDIEIHKELWNVLLQEFEDEKDELTKHIVQEDENGENFLHLLIKVKSMDVVKFTFSTIIANFNNKQKIFKSRNRSNMNLLHSALTSSIDLELFKYLWSNILSFLRIHYINEKDDNKNNIIHFAVHYSDENIFNFIVDEIENKLSVEEIKKLLTDLNSQKSNIIQIAAKHNNNIELHRNLWEILRKYLMHNELVDLINSVDNSSANVLFSAMSSNTNNIVHFIWNQIHKTIKNYNELDKYLKETNTALKSSKEYEKVSNTINDLINQLTFNHPHGKPENVLRFGSEEFKINIEKLTKIFTHEEVKNRKIVAFSVIGAFRRGKSYFLNYCLRYLYANYSSINNLTTKNSNEHVEWLGDENEPLRGFSWRSGSKRDTIGITLWDDVFLYEDESTNSKFGIIVLDTQGLFDNQTSPADNIKIFALGTLVSSIQILNISQIVQEDQLEYLQFATEYAKFSDCNNKRKNGKCFQNLMFLIRDWFNEHEFDYGLDGGNKYLENFLKADSKNKELQPVRECIKKSFDDLSCYLLPNPGKRVSSVQKNTDRYNGCHKEMDEDFKEELTKLIEHLLSPKKLVVKKINQNDLTGIKYLEYIEHFFQIFQSTELPKAQSIYDSTVEKHMNGIVSACIDNYKQEINNSKCHINKVDHVEIFHNMSKNQALVMYHESNKMGDNEKEIYFENILKAKIDADYEEWKVELISKVENKLLEDQKVLEEKEAELGNLKHENNRIKKDLSKTSENFDKLKSEMSSLKDEYHEKEKAIENQLSENKLKLEEVKSNLRVKENELKNSLDEKAKNEQDHKEKIENIKVSSEEAITKLTLNLKELEKKNKDLEILKSDLILKKKELELQIDNKIKNEVKYEAEIQSIQNIKEKEIAELTSELQKLKNEIKDLEQFKIELKLKERELELSRNEIEKTEKKYEFELQAVRAARADDIKRMSSEVHVLKQENGEKYKELLERNTVIKGLENELNKYSQEKISMEKQAVINSESLKNLELKMAELKDRKLKEKQELELKNEELKLLIIEREKRIEQFQNELQIVKLKEENLIQENRKINEEMLSSKSLLEKQMKENLISERKWKIEVDKLNAEIAKFSQCYILKPISEGNAQLINELKGNGTIKSSIVENVMKQTDRKLYCRTELPYLDRPQSIGYSVTISAPHMHALALENLLNNLKPDSKVLDVGSGSGYLTMCFARFLLAQSVQSTGIVIGIDNNPHLVKFSIENLNSDDPKYLSTGKIKIVKGDGRLGCSEYGPYDAIHVGAAAAEVPDKLLEQLKPGGRMMIPIGPKSETQKLQLYDKTSNGKIEITSLMDVLYGSLKDYDD